LSPVLFSCGMALSTRAMTAVFQFFFARRAIVPSEGPMNGSQNRMIRKSGFSLRIALPTESQLNGLMELILVSICTPAGGVPEVSYCVVPGKRKEGYCKEKEMIFTSCPAKERDWQSSSLSIAIPPRKGQAGPTMIIFFFSKMLHKGKRVGLSPSKPR
jgi:hypothetical protein